MSVLLSLFFCSVSQRSRFKPLSHIPPPAGSISNFRLNIMVDHGASGVSTDYQGSANHGSEESDGVDLGVDPGITLVKQCIEMLRSDLKTRYLRIKHKINFRCSRYHLFAVSFEILRFDVSVLHALPLHSDLQHLRTRLDCLQVISDTVIRWENAFDVVDREVPSIEQMRDAYCALQADLLRRFVEISKQSADIGMENRGEVFAVTDPLIELDQSVFALNLYQLDFADLEEYFKGLNLLSHHFNICELRLARCAEVEPDF